MHLPETQKQWIWLTTSAEVGLKSIIAETVVAKKSTQAKESGKAEEDFQAGKWCVQPIGFSVINEYCRVYKRYVNPTVTITTLRTEKALP